MYDSTFNRSMVISSCIHLIIIFILSFFYPPKIKIEVLPSSIEVEILRLRPQVVMPKEKEITSKMELPKKIASNPSPNMGQKLNITSVLGNKEGSLGSSGRLKYILPIKESENHPLFERVERGESLRKEPVSIPERLAKGEASAHLGLEAGRGLKDSQIEEGIRGRGIEKIPPYHLEGPVTVGRDIVYQESMQIPKWVKEEGRSLRGKLRFWVLPSGEVDRVLVEETFGHSEIDDLAKRMIRRWRFTKGQGEAWGVINIRIELN